MDKPALKKVLFIALAFVIVAEIMLLITTNNNVSSNDTPLHTSFLNCIRNNENRKDTGYCLKDLAIIAVQSYSIQEIDAEMNKIQDSGDRQWCHEFMHYAGWELYNQTESMFDSFSVASSQCDSGMFHGVAEEYINQASLTYSPEEFAEEVIPTACEDRNFKQDTPEGVKYLCYHGLGHAFMFITNNELNETLKYCDLVKNGYEGACYTGAFMENVLTKQVGNTSGHTSEYAYDDSDPDYPCNSLDEKYKHLCYVYKGVSHILLTNVDVEKSVVDCQTIDPDYVDSCLWGVGNNIPGPHISSSAAAEKCSAALDVSERAYEQCISGGMTFLVQLNTGNISAVQDYCEAVEADYRGFCYSQAGSNLANWTTANESLEQKCSELENKLAQDNCAGLAE